MIACSPVDRNRSVLLQLSSVVAVLLKDLIEDHLSFVRSLVHLQVATLGERMATNLTRVRLLTRVNSHMNLEAKPRCQTLATLGTLVRVVR